MVVMIISEILVYVTDVSIQISIVDLFRRSW